MCWLPPPPSKCTPVMHLQHCARNKGHRRWQGPVGLWSVLHPIDAHTNFADYMQLKHFCGTRREWVQQAE